MTIDYALIRLSLFLSNFQPLDFYGASKLVNHWLAPITWLTGGLERVGLSIVGSVSVASYTALIEIGAILALPLMIVLIIGTDIVYILCFNLAPLLGHAMALGWSIWYALGGA